jgi:hypothetical protein
MIETIGDQDFSSIGGPGAVQNVFAPLQAIHIRLKLTSKSPLIPSPSYDFSYFSNSASPTIADVTQVAQNVAASIALIPAGGTNAPTRYLSPVISIAANAHLWEVYDVSNHLDGTPAGSPVALGSFTISTVGATGSCPEGSSAALTLQAPYGSDVEFAPGTRPRARDRGRIYWGPLSATLSYNSDTNGRTTLGPAISVDLPHWIKAIAGYTSAASGIVWALAVWSRKNAGMKQLAEVWLDDRPDYQRRRGGKAGSKTILSLP